MLATATTVKVLTQNLNCIIRRDLKANAKLNPFYRQMKNLTLLVKYIGLQFTCTGQLSESCRPKDQNCSPKDQEIPICLLSFLISRKTLFLLPLCFPPLLLPVPFNSNLKNNNGFGCFVWIEICRYSLCYIFDFFFSRTHQVILILPLKYL